MSPLGQTSQLEAWCQQHEWRQRSFLHRSNDEQARIEWKTSGVWQPMKLVDNTSLLLCNKNSFSENSTSSQQGEEFHCCELIPVLWVFYAALYVSDSFASSPAGPKLSFLWASSKKHISDRPLQFATKFLLGEQLRWNKIHMIADSCCILWWAFHIADNTLQKILLSLTAKLLQTISGNFDSLEVSTWWWTWCLLAFLLISKSASSMMLAL